MSLLNRVLLYLLPLPLWAIEYALRLALDGGQKAAEFFAPAVAAAGIGLIVPTTFAKKPTTDHIERLFRVRIPAGYVLQSAWDKHVVEAAIIAFVVSLAVWSATVFVSLGGKFPGTMLHWMHTEFGPILACATIYFVGVLLTELKERR